MIVGVTYLKQNAPDELRPPESDGLGSRLVQQICPCPELARFLYRRIGRPCGWSSRLSWSDGQWTEWLTRPDRELWVSWQHGPLTGFAPRGHAPALRVGVGGPTARPDLHLHQVPRPPAGALRPRSGRPPRRPGHPPRLDRSSACFVAPASRGRERRHARSRQPAGLAELPGQGVHRGARGPRRPGSRGPAGPGHHASINCRTGLWPLSDAASSGGQ